MCYHFSVLLPTDTKVNEEATKALLLVAPDLKEGALNNPRLDAEWLWTSLETQLKEQRDMMGKIALEVHRLILKDGQELEADELEMVAYCCIQLGESEREVEYTHRAKQIREQLKKSEIAYER
jgi:hypothetical protein